MENSGGYQSLLGLTSINSNSSTIDVLNVENITINGVIDLSQAIVGGLTTSQVDEGLNLYYTDTRVNNNSNVSSNTTHRDRTDNPHAVTATQVGIDDTDDISEGVTNLYYTDIRFDDRLATKTTSNLTEGTNLYYTDARFDTRLATKTTDNLTEGTNLYYTTARANADFDTRLAVKVRIVMIMKPVAATLSSGSKLVVVPQLLMYIRRVNPWPYLSLILKEHI